MSEQIDAVRDLYQTAKEDPDAVDVEDALSNLDYEDPTVRNLTLRALTALASDDADRVAPYVDDLRPHLDDEYLVSKTAATGVFGFLAENDPDDVVPSIPDLVDLLDQEPPLLRFRAARALSPLLAHSPEEFVPHTDRLVDVLVDGPEVTIPDPDDPEIPEEMQESVASVLENREGEFDKDLARSRGVFEFAANAVVEIAERDPERVTDRVDDLATMVDDEQALVRTAVVDTLATLAEDDPDTVAPAVDALRDQLDDEHEYIRAHAVRALGFAEATDAVDDLRALAEEDVDEDLRELAVDTADWLESQA